MCSTTADDFKFLESVMNAFVAGNFTAHILQIPHVRIIFKELIVTHEFVCLFPAFECRCLHHHR